MPKFEFPISMDIRAYGSVTIDGDTPEDALEKLNADIVADKFEPDSNADALDWKHPREIYVFPSDHELEGNEIETPERDLPEGSWVDERYVYLVQIHQDMEDWVTHVYDNQEQADEEMRLHNKSAYHDHCEDPDDNATPEEVRKWLFDNVDDTQSFECKVEKFPVLQTYKE